MAIINFAVPRVLEEKIKIAIAEKGFSSKAELFRFALIRYLDEGELGELALEHNPDIAALTKKLEKELMAKLGSRPLPSMQQQLRRMKHL